MWPLGHLFLLFIYLFIYYIYKILQKKWPLDRNIYYGLLFLSKFMNRENFMPFNERKRKLLG